MDIYELEWIGRIILSGLLSGIIGWEREKHGREAGLRTIVLVGMGTATIMITSLRIYELFEGISDNILRIDPARIAYGVVTGIGFLGAGAIVKDVKRIRGITTAACLWIATSIGLTIGCGFYLIGIGTTIFALITLYTLKKLEHRLPRDTYNKLIIISKIKENILSEIKENILLKEKLEILSISIEKNILDDELIFTFSLRHKGMLNAYDLIEKISTVKDVKNIKWE